MSLGSLFGVPEQPPNSQNLVFVPFEVLLTASKITLSVYDKRLHEKKSATGAKVLLIKLSFCLHWEAIYFTFSQKQF